jgi:signal transduction histidine kinase
LAGGIAHDFNNLLTIIQGNTELTMIKTSEADPLYMNLKQIRSATMRTANLTRQLLVLSRKQPMNFTTLNLGRIVDDFLKMLHRLIGEDIAIETYLVPDLWLTQADAGNMEQLIMNLVVNARDAMPDGGLLTIKTENIVLDEDYAKFIPYASPGKFVHYTDVE